MPQDAFTYVKNVKDFFWKILGFCFDLLVCYVSFVCDTLSVLEVQLLSAGKYSAENGEITKMHQSEYLKKQNKTKQWDFTSSN